MDKSAIERNEDKNADVEIGIEKYMQKVFDCIDGKIQSARELGNIHTLLALKNLKRELEE